MTVSNEFAYGFVPLDSTLAETPSAQSLVLRFTKAPSELPFIQGFKSIGQIDADLITNFGDVDFHLKPPVEVVKSDPPEIEKTHVINALVSLRWSCFDEFCGIHKHFAGFKFNRAIGHWALYSLNTARRIESKWKNEIDEAKEHFRTSNHEPPHLTLFCEDMTCQSHEGSHDFDWHNALRQWVYTGNVRPYFV